MQALETHAGQDESFSDGGSLSRPALGQCLACNLCMPAGSDLSIWAVFLLEGALFILLQRENTRIGANGEEQENNFHFFVGGGVPILGDLRAASSGACGPARAGRGGRGACGEPAG